MPLVHMGDMLRHAYDNHFAVGAFDVVSPDFITGVIAAAEQQQAPVIISLAESRFDFFDFELLMAAVVVAAQRTAVPVAIHMDHVGPPESVVRAINHGCNGVMVDASHLPLDDNIAATGAVVEMAHACGIPVEGSPGYVPGVEGEDAGRHPGDVVDTSVPDARRFVQETGVDFLAVSIGTVHGRMKAEPRPDFDRLAAINQALNIPLVIHGGTGPGQEQFNRLIENGVARINSCTELADAAGRCIASNAQKAGNGSYTTLLRGAAQAVQKEAARCIGMWGGSGRAGELLACCRPWLPVEHAIFYNTEGLDEAGVEEMMAEGRRVLGAIPGVRRVFTGRTVHDDRSYRYCWLVRFASRAVIESYRLHPAHQQFADERFRPVAGGRVSIDFEECALDGS